MAVLKYVTRGEQTAQGKQKAYFCAHHDDYGSYFEKISNEILSTLEKENNRNCALFYLEDANAERDDDFKFNFKEMNLIVMPVTTRLLTTANPALDIEFKLAAEYGIPVLPLMMESGLEDMFNAKCGDIQFLDPNSRDATAISYEEKLTKYLTSVLIGDELAEKIRKAFDAYIFLSYRKKDRQYAQELMRLIHKNEFCRDIAIWYDEFLTPGENFNKSIEDALKKSKLFALAVTPNLVNEENYVMTVEYPMAKKADKLILPAELVETDKTALSEKYEGIPECVRSDDDSALSASLENALEGIALRENDNDPEHNFFIGLAYLGGVDVEKDNERAIKLITSSAEAGLPEAMEKLVSIYRNGEIGARDYEKAIEWQRKLVEYRKKVYIENQDEDSAFYYLHDIWDLGDYIYELRRIDAAEEVYKEMLTVSKDIYNSFSKDWSSHLLSISYDNIGNIYMSKGDITQAEEYYIHSLRIREEMVYETNSVESKHNIATSYINIGKVLMVYGYPHFAEKYYLKAVNLYEKLADETNSIEIKQALCICYDALGDIHQYDYVAINGQDKAKLYYLKSLNIRKNTARETNITSYNSKIARSCFRLGNLFIERNDFVTAEKYFFKALELTEALVQETGTIQSQHDLAFCYNNLGQCRKFNDDLNEAKKYYLLALKITKKLVRETNTATSYANLAISHYYLSEISLNEKEDHLKKALEIFTKLNVQAPYVSYYSNWIDLIKNSFD